MLTGEPLPVTKRVGDKLTGATMNISGAVVMRSEHVGSATVLAQIVQMVAMATMIDPSFARGARQGRCRKTSQLPGRTHPLRR
jgi:cation transport ATPase